MPQPRVMETTHHPRQPRKLYRLPNRDPSERRESAKHKRRSVSVLLQRIVGLFCHRLGTEEKVVAHHRPNPWNITRRKQDLPIIPAEDLIPEIQHAAAYVDPH